MYKSSWLNYEFPAQAVAAVKGIGIEVRSALEAQDAWFSLSPGPFRPGSAYRGRYEYPFIAWIHYPHLAGGAEWTTPVTRLHVHAGDWHTIAAEHASGTEPPRSRKWRGLGAAVSASRRIGSRTMAIPFTGHTQTCRRWQRRLPMLASTASS
jgi:hypothetical protein